MNNIGANILMKENLSINLERLAAQRQIYSDAKLLFATQFILNVIVTVSLLLIGFVINYLWEIKMDWFRALYGFIILIIDQLIINVLINQLRQKAAAIQELFDCDVLSIEWNRILVGEKPNPEDVNKYYKKHLKKVGNLDKLKDWYANTIDKIESIAAKVICQRSNYSYDYELRKNFLFWLVTIAILILVLMFFFSTVNDMKMQLFFLSVIIPFMPILSLTLKLYNEHSASLKNLESLKSNINSLWQSILKGDNSNLDVTIRQIQDKIFMNRKSNPLVPDWVFNKLQNGLEEQMYYSVSDLIEEYKMAQEKRQNTEGGITKL